MYLTKLYSLLEPYKRLGELTLKYKEAGLLPYQGTSTNNDLEFNKIPPDGTKLIAKVLCKRSYANDVDVWLHNLFSPLSFDKIEKLEEDLQIEIPKVYKNFLLLHNGLSIFYSLSLYGMRFNYKDDDYNVMSQPFSILLPNIDERPEDSSNQSFFIGSYLDDASLLYIDKESSKVHRCDRDYSKKVFNTWDSFEEMLLSETKRLIALFDEEGKLIDQENPTIDEDKPTTPEPMV